MPIPNAPKPSAILSISIAIFETSITIIETYERFTLLFSGRNTISIAEST